MIKIEMIIKKPHQLVYQTYFDPKHIVNFNFASEDWYCPQATNNFVVNGRFCYTMSSKNRANTFDFEGTFTSISPFEVTYVLDDNRLVVVRFEPMRDHTKLTIEFEAELEHDKAIQQAGWYAILNQFKGYVESLN